MYGSLIVMNLKQPRYYTRKELAELLRVSLDTIDRWKQKGVIKGFTIEGSVRFTQEEIDQLVERGTK
jgi:excisionase family DNA binding protein